MYSNAHPYPGPDDIIRTVLENGITVLIRENHSAPVAVLAGCIPTGSLHDPADKSGLSSFVSSMLTRGSATYDFDSFNQTVESVGASLTIHSGTHLSNFGAHCLSEDFSTMIQVLADVLAAPTFPEEHIELVRNQKIVQLQERDEDTQDVANLRFHETIYPDHPYGRPTSGYAHNVASIQREDLVAFHHQRYTPQGAIIVVSGDVEANRILDQLARDFGDWQGDSPQQEVPTAQRQTAIQRIDCALPGKHQTDIVLGCLAVNRLDPDFDAVRIANTILGQFGMMGRLGERIREEQGLAYYAYSSLETERAAGVWSASAGVSPENVAQAIDSMVAEIERLGSEPVHDAELADTQAYMTGVVPLTLETNGGIASTLLSIEWHALGLDYLHRYNDAIFSVTPADVQRVAQRYLDPNAYTLVVAGPPQN
ncbi:MAG: insulinase family protein [Caldilineaceae bacterium]|nr:insulinase family protein [Caldilineaceae bacterium]